MRNINIVAKVAFVFAVLFLAGCSDKPASNADKNSFEIVDLNDKKSEIAVRMSDGKFNDLIYGGGEGKPTIYSFFTTQCPECIKKIPHLIDLQNRMGDKVNLVGVMVEHKSLEEIKDFCDFYNINYKVVVGRGSFRLADAVGGVKWLPAVHIYDKDGKYVHHYIGAVPQEMLESRINTLVVKDAE